LKFVKGEEKTVACVKRKHFKGYINIILVEIYDFADNDVPHTAYFFLLFFIKLLI
jgi:hypothetical protein